MILGLDWLEANSPMKIHWSQKWIQFSHHGSPVYLVGILPELPAGVVLQLCAVDSLPPSDVESLPTEGTAAYPGLLRVVCSTYSTPTISQL